jgi:hypothetical protein
MEKVETLTETKISVYIPLVKDANHLAFFARHCRPIHHQSTAIHPQDVFLNHQTAI